MFKSRILLSLVSLIIGIFSFLIYTTETYAGGSRPPNYKAGFQLLVTWDQEDGSSVEFLLWYPTRKEEKRVTLGPWTLYGGRDGAHIKKKFPLIIISHDTGANKFSYNDTARLLAMAGFVVAAPTHSTDNNNNMKELYTAEHIFGRVKDVHLLVDFLKQNEFKEFVDTDTIGILGVGTGSNTALILGGGIVDISAYSDYCNEYQGNNNFCKPWVKQRLTTLSFYLPQSPDCTLTGVKALALAAPSFSMFFTNQSLSGINSKICIYDAELDPYDQAEALRKLFPRHQKYVVLPGMDSRDLTTPCTDALQDESIWYCDPEPDDSLRLRQKLFNSSLEKFFSQQLYELQ